MAPENDMNEVFEETMADATVITVPIDATLSHANEAADAKAVGDALDLKADKSQIVTINVNGQEPDNQGTILIDGTDIPVSGTDTRKLDAAIAAAESRTGATIPVSPTDPTTIQEAINTSTAKYATNIPMSDVAGAVTIATKISTMDDAMEQLDDSISNVQDNANSRVPYTGKTSSYSSLHQSSYTIESSTRHLIMLISNNNDSFGMWLVNCSNTGAVTAIQIYKGSNITEISTASANRFRYTVTTEYTIRLFDLDLTNAYTEES